jgi:hypothetical protein
MHAMTFACMALSFLRFTDNWRREREAQKGFGEYDFSNAADMTQMDSRRKRRVAFNLLLSFIRFFHG